MHYGQRGDWTFEAAQLTAAISSYFMQALTLDRPRYTELLLTYDLRERRLCDRVVGSSLHHFPERSHVLGKQFVASRVSVGREKRCKDIDGDLV